MDAYKLSFVNLIISGLFLLLLIIYRFLYPQRKLPTFLLLLIVSIFPILSIFRTGVYESGDFALHIYRSISFYKNLIDGNLMPSWAADLNNLYGYPLFIFLNPLPYYVISFFHFIGFPFIISMKLFLATTFIASGASMYWFIKNETKSEFAAFTSAIFYLFTPYHLVDLHFRVTIGELLFFSILPFCFFNFSKFFETRKPFYFIVCLFSIYLLFLTHQIMAVFSLGVLFPYSLYKINQNKNSRITLAIILFVGFIFAFVGAIGSWLPYISLTQYTLSYLLTKDTVSFLNLENMLFSPWRYGFLFQGPKGQLSFLIGYTQILVLLVSIYVVIKRKGTSQFLLFWTTLALLYIFFLLPISEFFWKIIPLINTAQFSYRLLLPLTFVISIIAGVLSLSTNKKILFILLLIGTVGYTMLNWGTRRVIPEIDEQALRDHLASSTINGEAFCCIGSPKWVDINNRWEQHPAEEPISMISNTIAYKEVERNSTSHKYIYSATTAATIKENTLFFPGWRATVDKIALPIDYTNPTYPGIITINLPSGDHTLHVYYKDIPILSLAKTITRTSFFAFLLLILFFSANQWDTFKK